MSVPRTSGMTATGHQPHACVRERARSQNATGVRDGNQDG
jgi:hypothetical protein